MLSTKPIDAAFVAPQATSRSSSSSTSASAERRVPPPRSSRLRGHRSHRLPVLVVAAASASPPPPPPPPPNSNSGGGGGAGRDFDVGRLWKEGGGVELTPEEAAVLREAAAKFSKNSSPGAAAVLPPALLGTPPPLPPPPAASSPPPPQHSALRDRAQFDRLQASSVATPSAFFGNLASGFEWRNAPASSHSKQSLSSPTTTGSTGSAAPPPPWFVGGRLNVALNCLDRHVAAGRGAQPAFVWPSSSGGGGGGGSEEQGDASSVVETLSYEAAASRVAELAQWLSRSAGVGAGDSVAIMLPPGGVSLASGGSSPLLPLAFLAVARVGGAALLLDPSAPAEENGAALASSGARVAVTASGGQLTLGGPLVPVKERLDAAADACFEARGHALETALCFEAAGVSVAETPWKCSRDVWSGAALGEKKDPESTSSSSPSSSSSSSSSSATAWPDANAPLLLAIAPGTGGSTLLAYPGAGLLVCSGAAARLSLDASSAARVAVASSAPWSEAAVVFGVLGPLANGGAAVVLPPPRDGAASAGSWWALADRAAATHVVADAASAAWLARSAAASGGAPRSVEVAMVVDAEPARPAVEALAASIGDRWGGGAGAEGGGGGEGGAEGGGGDEAGAEGGGGKRIRRPVVAAWMPAGAGCPVLAAAPLAAEASRPGGMLPWLGCAPYLLGSDGGDGGDGGGGAEDKEEQAPAASVAGRPALAAAWPSMARSAMGPDAQGWLRDSVLCGPKGEFSPPTALFEVQGGEWYWSEAGQ